MAITVTFDPPLPSDSPSVFNTKAFTLLGDLNDWSTEANSLASTVSSNASTSTTNASNASTSADAAATSASNAAASYDSFDDRYLGSKSSAPTLDNDGAALLTGALYWDSVLSAMFVRTSGGAWTALNASTGIAQAITANSSSAALTVTQTGAGNAFVVEDSASTDATPFVVDAGGNVVVGHTAKLTTSFATSSKFSVAGANLASVIGNYTNDVFGARLDLVKSRSTTINAQTVVQSGDSLGLFYFSGSDGTGIIPATSIAGEVDGTPGTNDMPGRLVFSTTADGDSSPTERMRIDSAGVVSMPSCGLTIATGRKITADVDTGNITLWGGNSTGANLELYGGSHATNASLAVLDASETRFRSQNGGTEFMRIDSAGQVGIGGTPTTGYSFQVAKNIGGATYSLGVISQGQVQSGVTNRADYFASYASTHASSTVPDIRHFNAMQGTFGNTPTAQYGFIADAGLIGATNNYGFYGNIAAGTGRYNFYAAGTAPNRFVGETLVIGAAGLGYGTGAGGTVTQATSKSTAVTLNKPCGQITMDNAALAAGTEVFFGLTNSLITSADVVVCNLAATLGGSYVVRCSQTYTGGATIGVKNITAGSLSDAPIITFAIIKGATA